MSTHAPHTPGEFGEPAARAARPAPTPARRYALKTLKALASLQATVVLFALGILLVFFGTLAQLDNGIWTVVDKYFYSMIVWVPTDLIYKFLAVFWKEWFPPAAPGVTTWHGSFPLPAGQLVGGLMIVNLLAAHVLRFRLTWKRSGIFLIHGGILVLFAGELITREFAVEQQMTIPQGTSVDFAEDTRSVELAFVDTSDPKDYKVAVISQKRLMRAKPGERISHPGLPVDVEVLKFMKHAEFKDSTAANIATKGAGATMIATEAKEGAGVDTKQRMDFTTAYVRLYDKSTGQDLGTHLVSLLLSLQDHSDEVKVGNVTHFMTLRRARLYKPYRIHLEKFKFDRYEGTSKARNYSSDVIVKDASGNEVRSAHISMNHPLRYAGETFYQSSFDKAETTTILQVVKNPGLLNVFGLFYVTVDYLACILVSVGMLLHFGIYLTRFLQRAVVVPPVRDPVAAPAPTPAPLATADFAPPPGAPVGATASSVFPWVMLGVAALFLLSVGGRMTPKAQREPYDLDAFARIPVKEGGRAKPLETVARVYLRTISHRETFEDENGDMQPAIRWYLDLLAADSPEDNSPAWKHRVFRIDNDQVRDELKLEHRQGSRYSFEEIRPHFGKLMAKTAAARMKEKAKKQPDLVETKMLELEEHLTHVMALSRYKALNKQGDDTLLALPPEGDKPWQSLGNLRDAARTDAELVGMTEAHKILQALQTADPTFLFKLPREKMRELVRLISRVDLDRLSEEDKTEALVEVVQRLRMKPTEVPPVQRRVWLEAVYTLLPPGNESRIRSMIESDFRARLATVPAAAEWHKIVTAYRDKKPQEFNAAVADYRAARLGDVPTTDRVRARAEVTYNRFAPFFNLTGLYVFGLLLALGGFVCYVAEAPKWAVASRRASFLVLLLTLVVHTLALVSRMYISNRWGVFVTNLYSSAVFIGWGCVALCLVLERIFPIGIGNVVAAVLGLATSIVAHNLGTNDTLEMLEAVLDTNFWLATHVTTVTLGYTATFVAGFLGALYVFMMLGAVIRESFLSTGEPTVGALLAFGAAAVGIVGLPLAFLAFMTAALDKFEVVNTYLLWSAFYLTLGLGIMYALGLMLMRVAMPGVDAQGKPTAGTLPGIAKAPAALALSPESGKILGQMVYGVLCFATLLSFVGTVLGGVWADQSWGRFWGWDPKENGAVLIVLWNSLILHARWCGLVKDRGVAVLAIFGNAITAWSWFGTNQLGIGLHAYGFDSRLADGCFNFWLSQMFILVIGAAIPRHFWAGAARKPVAAASQSASAAPNVPPPSPNGQGPSANGTHPAPPPDANGQAHRRDRGKRSKRR